MPPLDTADFAYGFWMTAAYVLAVTAAVIVLTASWTRLVGLLRDALTDDEED